MTMKEYLSWTIRILTTFIIFQIVYFKLSGDPKCIYVFKKVGGEPIGRLTTGLIELLAGILLLVPTTKIWGAIIAFLAACCCLYAHFTVLGIIINNDGGLLFAMTFSVFILSIILFFLHQKELLFKHEK